MQPYGGVGGGLAEKRARVSMFRLVMTLFLAVLWVLSIVSMIDSSFSLAVLLQKHSQYKASEVPVAMFNPVVPEVPLSTQAIPFKGRTFISQTRWPLRVVLYGGPAASQRSWRNIRKLLRCASNSLNVTVLHTLKPELVTRENFDVIVIPGGEANKIMDYHISAHVNLRQVLRTFVSRGGGLVGICSGAYLTRFVKMSPFKTGFGVLGYGYFTSTNVTERFAEQALYPVEQGLVKGDQKLLYANGPVFIGLEKKIPAEITNPEVLMTVGDSGFMVIQTPKPARIKKVRGHATLVTNLFYAGRVVISTGHPESDISGDLDVEDIRPGKCDTPFTNIFLSSVFLAANRTGFPSQP